MASHTGSDFTFSSDVDFPNKVKLRKRIPFWLLEFTVGVDHDRLKHTLKPACIVKDKFLKGVFDLDVVEKRVEYRKVCGIPFVGRLVLNAGLNYQNPLRGPRIGINFSTSGPTAVVSGDATKFDQKLSLGKRVGLEVHKIIPTHGYTLFALLFLRLHLHSLHLLVTLNSLHHSDIALSQGIYQLPLPTQIFGFG